VIVFGTFLAPSLYLLLALTGWSPLRWLTLFLAGMHGLAWVTSLSADFSSVSPGANDNASAVGTVLALGERLRQQPLEHTEVWLAFTGCEESGADGMIHLLQQEGEALRDALMINFELVGIGERLVYLQSEGVLRKQKIHPDVERLVKEVGQEFGLVALNGSGTGVFTETGVASEHGFDGVCFLARRSDSILLPEWHRPSDTPDRLQADTLDRVHELTWALLQKIDN
jgi:Zn-dependent M28 family amino/carboxypeptidase